MEPFYVNKKTKMFTSLENTGNEIRIRDSNSKDVTIIHEACGKKLARV